jgi:GT2 family glycosyltransferase
MVSVIIPTYDRPKLLLRAVRSVLAQDFRDLEVIVVDDHSPTSAEDMLRAEFVDAFSQGVLRCLRNETNCEKSLSRNRGVAAARGELLAFLDDDDFWMPTHLSMLTAAKAAYPDCAAVFGNYVALYEDGYARLGLPGVASGAGQRYREMCVAGELSSSCYALIEKKAFSEAGGYDASLRVCEDRDLMGRIAVRHDVCYTSMPTLCIWVHAATHSFRSDSLQRAEMKERAVQKIMTAAEDANFSISPQTRARVWLDLAAAFSCDTAKEWRYARVAVGASLAIVGTWAWWSVVLHALLRKKRRR